MLDIAVIGAGPAGLSAGISGVLRNKKTKVFGKNPNTSWLYKAEKVNNYLGLPNVTGAQIINQYVNHAKQVGVEITEGRVLQIMPMGDYFMINVENNFFQSKTIVLAIGIQRGKYLASEKEYIGKGVSYCATCDGPLYKNKQVILYGESEEAEEDLKYLKEISSKVIYISNKYSESIENNVEYVNGKPDEILGNDSVTGIKLKDGRIFDAEGVFIIKESTPIGQLIPGLEIENNAIKVNRFMETNIAGVYGAGDCTGKPLQVSKAVGEGLIAAQQAIKYIDKE